MLFHKSYDVLFALTYCIKDSTTATGLSKSSFILGTTNSSAFQPET